jgi:hypothetical protein
MKVVRLSALRTGRLYPPGNIPGTHFFLRLSQPQGPHRPREIAELVRFSLGQPKIDFRIFANMQPCHLDQDFLTVLPATSRRAVFFTS